MSSANYQTPTWLRFQQLDSASEETATSSNQGRVRRIPILHTLSQLQNSQSFHKKLQSFSKQFQVALLPVQWMPFPAEKEFYTPGSQDISQSQQRSSTYKTWITRMTFLHVHGFYSDPNSIRTNRAITDL